MPRRSSAVRARSCAADVMCWVEADVCCVEAETCSAGAGRFDRRIEGEEVRLACDAADRLDDARDRLGVVPERLDGRGGLERRLAHRLHRLARLLSRRESLLHRLARTRSDL